MSTYPEDKNSEFKENKAVYIDSESNDLSTPYPQEVKLQRQLKNRHVAMISIGGTLV